MRMDPRVKPKDEGEEETACSTNGLRCPPCLSVVILGLDPRIHTTSTAYAKGNRPANRRLYGPSRFGAHSNRL